MIATPQYTTAHAERSRLRSTLLSLTERANEPPLTLTALRDQLSERISAISADLMGAETELIRQGERLIRCTYAIEDLEAGIAQAPPQVAVAMAPTPALLRADSFGGLFCCRVGPVTMWLFGEVGSMRENRFIGHCAPGRRFTRQRRYAPVRVGAELSPREFRYAGTGVQSTAGRSSSVLRRRPSQKSAGHCAAAHEGGGG